MKSCKIVPRCNRGCCSKVHASDITSAHIFLPGILEVKAFLASESLYLAAQAYARVLC